MFLAYESNGGESSFGFYKSKEGREFLRRLFRPYLRRQSMGEGKAASIISDAHANPDTQASEVDKTKSALRRWGREGQSELWPKDEEKNLRQMRRLENEFISVPELKEVLEDTAETVQKHQSGVALSFFFYGSLPPSRSDPKVAKLHENFEGLFSITSLVKVDEADPFERIKTDIINQLIEEVRTKGVAPNTIQIDPKLFDFDTSGFVDTYETNGFREARPSDSKFIRFTRVPNRNFMLAQTFEIEMAKGETGRVRRLSAGYAFPLKDGTLHIFLSDFNPPSHRTYMSLSPDETAQPDGKVRSEGDQSWRVVQHPFSQVWESLLHGNRPEYWTKVTPDHGHYWHLDVDKLNMYLDRTLWNFLP